MNFETRAIQAARPHDATAASVSPPIYLSTTFEREPDGSYAYPFFYSRAGNPNRSQLETGLAALEGGAEAFAFGSGMAAMTAVFQALRPGDHVITSRDTYFTLQHLLKEIFEPWGLSVSYADTTDPAAIEAALLPETRLIWLETPSNPLLRLNDIDAVVALARPRGIWVAVDNTWATPVLQRPLEAGADLVMHSTTKYIGGHSDVLGGALIVRENGLLTDRLRSIESLGGAVPSPFDCWLLTRGLQTLALRVRAQSETAARLAAALEGHPAVGRVHYPGLKSHPQHALACRQMPGGCGAMFSLEVKGDFAAATAVEGRLKLFTRATSLGGVESLVEQRKRVEGPGSPTPDTLLRVSVGLEHFDDLLADWQQALAG